MNEREFFMSGKILNRHEYILPTKHLGKSQGHRIKISLKTKS